MRYIVNKYGVIHTIPAQLLGQVQAQGGRLATPSEIAAYKGGIDATVAEAFPAPAADDLTLIGGIGDKTAKALNAFGILTYTALITADPAEVAQAVGGKSVATIRRWQNDALELSNAQREAQIDG